MNEKFQINESDHAWGHVHAISPQEPLMTIGAPRDEQVYFIRINRPTGELLVQFKSDGVLEFGDTYEPDEAARIFWEAMSRNAPHAGGQGSDA